MCDYANKKSENKLAGPFAYVFRTEWTKRLCRKLYFSRMGADQWHSNAYNSRHGEEPIDFYYIYYSTVSSDQYNWPKNIRRVSVESESNFRRFVLLSLSRSYSRQWVELTLLKVRAGRVLTDSDNHISRQQRWVAFGKRQYAHTYWFESFHQSLPG